MIHSFSKRLTKALVLCCAVFFSLSSMSCSLFEPVEKGELSFTVTREMVNQVNRSIRGNLNYSDPVVTEKEPAGQPVNSMFITITLSKGFNGEQTVPFIEGQSVVFKDVTLGVEILIDAQVFERFVIDGKEEIIKKFTGNREIRTIPGNNNVNLELHPCKEDNPSDPAEPVDPVEPDPDDPVDPDNPDDPVETVDPAEPVDPVEPVDTDPDDPVEPVDPDPDDPVDPDDPDHDEPVSQFIQKTIYVSSDGNDTSYEIEGEDGTVTEAAADGSEDMPFLTLARACEEIIAGGSEYTDWTIYICGELLTSATVEIPADITLYKAHSILLTGISGVDEETGEPQAVINRGVAGSANGLSNGTVLVINTAVPVTITNLKITGGYGSSSNAGGINIAQGAVLTLADGALITGHRNTSNGRGGAIHNEGTLFMYGSAIIGDKTNGGKTSEDDYTYASDSSSYTTFNNKGMANYGSAGGGIYNGSDTDSTVAAKVYLGYKLNSDGNPEKAELTGGLYYNGGTGGAIYNVAGSFVYFDSGTFAWNGTEGGGGAIKNAGTLEMTGGTIEHNRALGTNEAYGGAVYNDSTAQFIMGGGTINHNLAYRVYSYGDKSYGGAVYNKGQFYMYGSAVIGDKDAATAASLDESHEVDTKTDLWGNKALYGGAIYSNTSGQNNGVFIGYKPDADGNSVEEELTGGLYYNYASYNKTQQSAGEYYGGGAIASTGTVKIASGTIAYNATAGHGGAIAYTSSCTVEISGGTIRDNVSELSGGAISIYASTSSVLSLSGSLSIPAGDDNKNDIYVGASSATWYSKITIAGTLGDSFAARLTPGFYYPDMAFIVNGGIDTDSFASICNKFSVADELNEELGTRTEWYINGSGKLASRTPLSKLTMTLAQSSYSDMTVSARYYADEDTYKASTSSTGGTAFYSSSSVAVGKYLVFIASLPSGKTLATGTGYTWYLDGEMQKFPTTVTDTSKFGVDTSEWAVGVYDIAVEATDSDGTSYSVEYHITVKAN